MIMHNEILICPNCKNSGSTITHVEFIASQLKNIYYMECKKCGAYGLPKYSFSDASDVWKREFIPKSIDFARECIKKFIYVHKMAEIINSSNNNIWVRGGTNENSLKERLECRSFNELLANENTDKF